ncbi:hypothetical protein ABIB94_007907 [Bradyrhizobium sp. JR7.2]
MTASPQNPRRGKNRVAATNATLDLFGGGLLPEDMKYQPEFLSADEELALLADIETLPFREFEFRGFTGKRRTVSFGWRYDLNGGGLTRTEDMPEFLSPVRARTEVFAGVAPGSFQQVRVTEYARAPGSAGIRIAPFLAMLPAFRCCLPVPSGSAGERLSRSRGAPSLPSRALSTFSAVRRALNGSTAFPASKACATPSRFVTCSKEANPSGARIYIAEAAPAHARYAD